NSLPKLYPLLERPSDGDGGVAPHPWEHMGVDGEGEGCARVPEHLRDDADRHALSDKQRRCGMSQVVKANPGHAGSGHHWAEMASLQVVGSQGSTECVSEDQVSVDPRLADQVTILVLALTVLAQSVHNTWVDGDDPATGVGLRYGHLGAPKLGSPHC